VLAPTKRGKGGKLMLLVDGAGLPRAIDIDSARRGIRDSRLAGKI